MRKTPSKMYIHNMVTIDITVFEIAMWVGGFQSPPPPPGWLTFSNSRDLIG